MTISVIICTRNRVDDLANCLESLKDQIHLPDEVVIVDSSDNDLVRALLKESLYESLPIKYIHTESGLTKQRNVGIENSHGDVVFFFDDDVVLDKKYIEKVVDLYQEKRLDNVGGVQGIDLNINKSFLEGKKRLVFHRLFLLNRRDKYSKLLASGNVTHLDVASPEIRYSKTPLRVFVLSGCLMSYHRKVLKEFKFDNSYDGYSHGEDVDFSHRVSSKYNLYFTPCAKAFHNQSIDKKKWYKTADFIESKIRCQIKLFNKHMSHNPINYLFLFWSWLGLLIWNGVTHPNHYYFVSILKAIRKEFFKFP